MAEVAEQSITCTNELGWSVTITSVSEKYLLTDFNPSGTSVEIYTTQAYGQDGRSSHGALLEAKELPLEFFICGEDVEEKYRLIQKVNQVFQPRQKIKLVYDYPLGQREIIVEVEKTPYYPSGFSNGNKRIQLCLVQLIAQKPIWYSSETVEILLTKWVPKFTFPFEWVDENMLEFGSLETNREVINDGEIDATCTIDIHGPANRPKVQNLSTGEFIQINREIKAGQHIQICTDSGNRYVELVYSNGTRENVLHWLGKGSKFFKLKPGVNIIDYTSDDSAVNATVVFSYRKQYVNM